MVKKIAFMLVACVGSALGQSSNASAWFDSTSLTTFPIVCRYNGGLNVYCPSNLTDNGTQLLYKGSPIGGGSGGLTSFTTGNLNPLFTAALGANPTTSPALAFTLSTAAQNSVFAGPATGGTGIPSYRALVAADIPALGIYATTAALSAEAALARDATNLASGRIGLPVTSFLRPFQTYDAWGDSITFSYLASSQLAAYPTIVGNHIGLTPINHGISGSTTQGNIQGVLNYVVPHTPTALQSVMLGTNDVTSGGNDANQAADFGQGILEISADLAIPDDQKTLASAMTTSGTWVAGQYTQSRKSTTLNNTLTFSATGTTVVLATVMQATVAAAGTGTLACDGTATGATLNFSGIGGTTIAAGTQGALTIVTGLTNTAHSCVVTVTSASGIVDVIWASGLAGASHPDFGPLLVGNIIPRNPDTAAGQSLYRAYNVSAVTNLNAIGLTNVKYVDTTTAVTPPINFTDNLHPDDFGYYLVAQQFISVIDTFVGYTLPNALYTGGPVVNIATANANFIIGPNGTHTTPTITTGNFNYGVGFNQAYVLTTGSDNTWSGYLAFSGATTALDNTITGFFAGNHIATTSNNSAYGSGSLQGTNPVRNSGFGKNSLNVSVGTDNSGFGVDSCVTSTAANAVTTDTFITCLGAGSGKSVSSATTLTNSTAVGAGALVAASNFMQLGNSSVTTLGVGTATWVHASGVPSGACVTGNLYTNTAGGTLTTFYVCESTAWVAK